MDLGKWQEAEASFRQALGLAPGTAALYYNVGNALREQGRVAEAEICYRTAAGIMPEFAEAHYNRAAMLQSLGLLSESERSYAMAIARQPDFAQAHNNRGTVLADLGHLRQAEQCYREALRLKPDHAFAYSNLGNVLREMGDVEEAERCYRRASDLRPDLSAVQNHLGNALRDLGRLEDAERSYRRAIEIDQNAYRAHSNLAFLLNYMPGWDAAHIYAEHKAFGQRFGAPGSYAAHWNSREPERKLRVGYVSGDLRDHSVAYFIEPVLAARDRRSFEIFCYFNHPRADSVTQRLRALADHWREIAPLGDESMAKLIRDDGIDILVDLSGHTAHNRLLAFARKPAPVQATWLGYLNTTGLAEMDYRITDVHASPPGLLDDFHSESLEHLPDSQWCYQPPADCPAVAPPPAARAGIVTFGVFTSPPKISDAMIRLWAQLLARVPGSRLVVLCSILGSIPEELQARFARGGIPDGRLRLMGSKSFRDYLAMHGTVDVMLDTAPYSGGTTTCHTLWMGVPLVTLAGRTATSRGGASLLHAVGLSDLVALDAGQYVNVAADLAQDRNRLAKLRIELRGQMACSPLMDAPRFAANLETLYREMWRQWCREKA